MQRKQNDLLNIAKAIASILVVFIHFPFPGTVGTIVAAFARVSVPLFFCISGYYLYKGDVAAERRSIPRKIKRLLWLVLFSECVYFAFYVALQIQNIGFSMQAVVNVIDAQIVQMYLPKAHMFLPVLAPPFNGTGWFMVSLIAAYMVFGWMYAKNWQNKAFYWAIGNVLMGICVNRVMFYCVGYIEIPYERTLPFIPLPFLVIGYHLRKQECILSSVSDTAYLLLFVLGSVLTVIEQFFGTFTLYIGTLILVPAMLAYCGKHKDYPCKQGLAKGFSHIGKSTATYIYILHMMVGNVLCVILPKLIPHISQTTAYAWLLPIIICIASAVTAEMAYRIKSAFDGKRR